MRLATNEIVVTIRARSFRLRPTLRAAFRLEQRHDGFDPIVRAVMDSNFTVLADVIAESAVGHHANELTADDVLHHMQHVPAQEIVQNVIPPIIDHVFALAGIDKDQAKEAPSGEPITFGEYHTRLFSIATGWLGWTPADAWDATPAEIIAAQKGRIDMLKAIFGTNEGDGDNEQSGPSEPSPDEVRVGIAKLKMLAANGGNRGV